MYAMYIYGGSPYSSRYNDIYEAQATQPHFMCGCCISS